MHFYNRETFLDNYGRVKDLSALPHTKKNCAPSWLYLQD